MGEEEVGIERLGDSLMLGERLAVVDRQRMDAGRKRRQQGGHRIRDGLRCLGQHMGELAAHRRRDAQPRTRSSHKGAFGGPQYSSVGCMIEVASTLTRAIYLVPSSRDRHGIALHLASG